MPGPGKAGEVERVLVGGRGDDGIHFAAERHAGGGLDRVTRDTAGAQDAMVVRGLAAAGMPRADGHPLGRRHGGDLVFGADEDDVRADRLGEGAGGDLGPDPPRIAERHRDAGHQGVRIST